MPEHVCPKNVCDLNSLIQQCLKAERDRNLSKNSIKELKRYLMEFGKYCKRKDIYFPNNLTPDFLRQYTDQRCRGSGPNLKKAVAWSLNRKESSIRSYFKYLRFFQVKGADAFPIECLPRARQPYPGPVEALTPKEVIKLLNTVDQTSVLGFRDLTLYTVLYSLGLRISEALNINIEDIDTINKVVHIHGKGRKNRTLPLTEDLLEIINKWIVYRTCLINAATLHALFVSKKGNRLAVL